MRQFLLFISSALLNLNTFAQDIQYMLSDQNLIYVNPAFAAYNENSRVWTSYINHWPAMSGNYTTTALAFDFYFEPINCGIAQYVHHDVAGQNTLQSTRVSQIFSFHPTFAGDWKISHGIELTYFQKKLDWSNLTFGDMIDPRRGFIYETQDTPRVGGVRGFDLGLGFISTYANKYSIGLAIHHVNEPNESLVVGLARLPMKFTIHSSARIDIYEGEGYNYFYLKPTLIIRSQDGISNFFIGNSFNFFGCRVGVFYQQRFNVPDDHKIGSLLVSAGMSLNIIDLNYCFGASLTNMTPSTGGAHELSFVYKF